MKSELLKYGVIGLAAVLLQMLIFNHLSYGPIQSDITLVVLIWVIATQNRTTAILFAAYVGVLSDFFLDYWGLHLMAKPLTTLLVYRFVPRLDESRLFFTQVFLILLGISVVHNLFFLLAAFFAQIYQAGLVFLQIMIGSSLMTAITGSIIYILRDN
jgi:rod shape-determining protein MreD